MTNLINLSIWSISRASSNSICRALKFLLEFYRFRFGFNSVSVRPISMPLPHCRSFPFFEFMQHHHQRPIIIKFPSAKLHFCINKPHQIRSYVSIRNMLPCTATLYLNIRERARPIQILAHVLHASKLLLPSRPTFQAKRNPQSTLQQFLLPAPPHRKPKLIDVKTQVQITAQ